MIINANWKIESDELNTKILKRHKVAAKNGKPASEYWSTEGYFSTPKNALNWLVNNEVMGTGMADLETVVAKIDELRNDIEGLEI